MRVSDKTGWLFGMRVATNGGKTSIAYARRGKIGMKKNVLAIMLLCLNECENIEIVIEKAFMRLDL